MTPRIMLLGTSHWSNPGLDYKTTDIDDMRAPDRQDQIAACIDRLALFAPTSVAIEVMADSQNDIDLEYRAYREGGMSLTANERHQLGYRLAARMGHDRVHGVDWHDLEQVIGWDTAIRYANQHEQDKLVSFFTDVADEGQRAEEADRIRRMTVREMLLELNDPERPDDGQRIYADMMLVGHGEAYVGADVILRWYERNMKIFVNIARLVESAEERILVVIGAGHLPLLQHFIEASGRFDLVSPVQYLK